MGRADYDQLEPGVAVAADANAIFSEVATQSAAVTGVNLGEEGMDGSAMASGTATQKAFAPVGDGTVATEPLTVAWIPVQPGVTRIRSSGSIVLQATDSLRVRGHVELLTDLINHGIEPGGEIAVRVGFQETGPVSGFAPCEGHADVDLKFVPLAGSPARIPITAWIDGPITLDWVQLEIRDQSGNDTTIQYGRVAMYGTIFRGVF
jgi:hypothetical protein